MTKLLVKRKAGQRIRINADTEIMVADIKSNCVYIIVSSPNNNLVTIVKDNPVLDENENKKS
ncbi:hypothetical protein CKF54_00570 [Psittacicella hinzii]|uniref:Carbon storage regulator n=1 Tax=Psittacicella hinzii TaxID=2028575 RepID=A0A3A1YE16_9GAMM|nr:carbon storage regulator [Psittacicella hinzii]RIY34424.1 hypothetical protein CKF54_00570 [Psittacicella hinzii]